MRVHHRIQYCVSAVVRHRRTIVYHFFAAIALQVIFAMLAAWTYPHSYKLTLPTTIPLSWLDGEYHRFATRKLANASFTHARNGGELGYVQMSRADRIEMGWDKHWSEDIAVESRLFGFPFPFCGYTFRYDCNTQLQHGAAPRGEPLLVHGGRYSISLRNAALSFASLLALCTVSSHLWRALRRRRPGICSQCGYSLAGLGTNVHTCPECGSQMLDVRVR